MFERKKRARTLAVPTEDKKVRERLREMGEPVCLFGEDVSVIELFELYGSTNGLFEGCEGFS